MIVVALFLLLFGAAAMHSFQASQVSEKIAGNQWEQERAYQASEAGLLDGQQWIYSQTEIYPPEGGGTSDVWPAGTISTKVSDPNYNWSDGKLYGDATDATTGVFTDQGQSLPRYVVENIGWSRDDASPENSSAGFMTFYYSVSSVGYGYSQFGTGTGTDTRQSDIAWSVLQSVSAKRYR